MTPNNHLTILRHGDRVEARHQWKQGYHGSVETVATHLGILWLRHGSLGERKLIDTAEYEIRKL